MKETNQTDSQDYSRPVAYDINGMPLYAHPAIDGQLNQTVHIARPTEPQKIEVSEAVKIKHEQSAKAYPELNLSESEYVISAVRRHPIGLIIPFAIGLFLIIIDLFLLVNAGAVKTFAGSALAGILSLSTITILMVVFLFIILAGILVSVFVYTKNRFFLTNESVIQEIQTGLFYKHEQTVSLLNIEDASFYKSGILQQMFDFGTIRLSTEGDETTYVFSYVANPKREIAMLNNAVEAFKNGRPVIND